MIEKVPDQVREKAKGSPSKQLFEPVAPFRVMPFDHFDLPASPPALHLIFPAACFLHALVRLEIDQDMHIVVPGETGDGAAPVLGHAPGQIGRDPGIEDAMRFAGEDVDERAHAPVMGGMLAFFFPGLDPGPF